MHGTPVEPAIRVWNTCTQEGAVPVGDGVPEKEEAPERGLRRQMVGMGGFEPPTLAVSGRCSPTELHAFSAERL